EDAVAHLGDAPARDQRRGFLDLEVVDLIPLLAPDDQHVAEAARGEKPDPACLALDDDVGAERRSVDRVGHVAPRDAAPRDQLVEPRAARLGRVGVGRQALRGAELPRWRLEHEIGECPPHVEADAVRHYSWGRAPGAISGWPATRRVLAPGGPSRLVPRGVHQPGTTEGGLRQARAGICCSGAREPGTTESGLRQARAGIVPLSPGVRPWRARGDTGSAGASDR